MKSLIICLSCAVFVPVSAFANVIFESGTLGPTGLAQGEVPGSNVLSTVFSGVRFHVELPVVTTHVGGHIVGPQNSTDSFFGAIVKLDDESDFPDSGDLSTADVLGTTVIEFPAPSAEVFGELTVSLDPGWYALVFGSGLFGALGSGAMPLNNPDIGHPTYIGWQQGDGWANLLTPIFRNYRFVVKGVPEPSSVILATLIIVFSILRRPVKSQ